MAWGRGKTEPKEKLRHFPVYKVLLYSSVSSSDNHYNPEGARVILWEVPMLQMGRLNEDWRGGGALSNVKGQGKASQGKEGKIRIWTLV